jgi:type VI secretion system secreted protein VgrG
MGSPGPQGPAGAQGPVGPQGPSGTDPSLVQQVSTLQTQLNVLRSLVSQDASGNVSLTSPASRSDLTVADQAEEVGGNRTLSVGGSETVTIGGSTTTTVSGNSNTQAAHNLEIDAGDSIVLKTGSASVQLNKDGTIVVTGTNITMSSSGAMLIQSGGVLQLRGSAINLN